MAETPSKTADRIKLRNRIKKSLISFLIESIPFVGDIAPSWTWTVYREAKSNLITPDALLMFFAAVILDLAGIFLFILSFLGVGMTISFFFDFVGLALIGGWMTLRTYVERISG